MIKIGLKPAMATSLAEGDNPVEQLDTIIDFAKAARYLPRSRFKVQGSTCSAQFKVSSSGFNVEP
jgi:hypothetical protein